MRTKSKGARKRLEGQEVEQKFGGERKGSNTVFARRGSGVECRQTFSKLDGTRGLGGGTLWEILSH